MTDATDTGLLIIFAVMAILFVSIVMALAVSMYLLHAFITFLFKNVINKNDHEKK
jgi:hypothetical protein